MQFFVVLAGNDVLPGNVYSREEEAFKSGFSYIYKLQLQSRLFFCSCMFINMKACKSLSFFNYIEFLRFVYYSKLDSGQCIHPRRELVVKYICYRLPRTIASIQVDGFTI